ncbi:hypothetical protein GL2_40860 [Microbulbifer sp. GL-2]|nr:hypothetical protein GL2_40860 [Microbulbifer sp. GL-2]
MLGQSHLENLLDEKLTEKGSSVKRLIKVDNIEIKGDGCYTTLNNGEIISSRYVVGADGSKSFVRNLFDVDFEIVRPNIIWAVIDGILDTDFPKVPEIIVFQAETADVAWIPREGKLDRFYVRMDTKEFSIEDAIDKINKVTRPYSVRFKEIEWFSQFSVRESVAENFILQDKIFLAGDAAHIHSVNGGQGLNTGISDAFNLIWKINMVMNHGMPSNLLRTYEYERKPVAKNVIEGSGELTRSTKFSEAGMHAQDYVKIIEKRAGYITGMGVEYSGKGLSGSRVFDFSIYEKKIKKRLYSILDYSKFTLLIVGDAEFLICMPKVVKLMQVYFEEGFGRYWTDDTTYKDKAILIRPDGHIESVSSLENIGSLFENLNLPLSFSIA